MLRLDFIVKRDASTLFNLFFFEFSEQDVNIWGEGKQLCKTDGFDVCMHCEMWRSACLTSVLPELESYLKSSIPCMWTDKKCFKCQDCLFCQLLFNPLSVSYVNGRIAFACHQNVTARSSFFLQSNGYVTLCNVYSGNIMGSLEPAHHAIHGFTVPLPLSNFYTLFENKHWEVFMSPWIHRGFVFVLSVFIKGENIPSALKRTTQTNVTS